MNGVSWCTATCSVVAALAMVGCQPAPAASDGLATVIAVVDGDTIDVRIGGRDERVRLIGIDTPETRKPNSPVECYGPEATTFTRAMLPVGIDVRLRRDIVGRDDYGRLLAYVYLVPDADGAPTTAAQEPVHVNLEIVRQGFATPLSIAPNTAHASDFAVAATDAEAADRGLWAACSG